MTTLFARHALLPDGWANNVRLTLKEGKIKSVETKVDKQAGDMDLGNQLLLPAVPNVHSHSFQRAMAGLSERRGASHDSFWTWREVMYRFLDHLSPQDIQAIAAFTFMEMAETGYASVGEFHYVHHQQSGVPYAQKAETGLRIVEAAKEIGFGLTHLPVLYRFGGVNGAPLKGGQQRFGSDLDLFVEMLEEIKPAIKAAPEDYQLGVAPHSLRAVNPELLTEVAKLLPNAPIHMHIAEQLAEVEDVETHWGQRPMDWLLSHLEVNERWCLIHCTHMTSEETIGLAKTGAVAGLCPITEANLGDGIFDGVRFTEHGGKFGFGSDSNIRISLAEEMRTLEHSQRYRDHHRAIMADPHGHNGQFLLQHVAKGGAQALARHSGKIEAGYFADLFTIAPDKFGADGLNPDYALDYWVFAARNDRINNLWSAGRHIVKGGQHIQREKIQAEFKRSVQRLRALI
jgi:formiminoglutamate deiminase